MPSRPATATTARAELGIPDDARAVLVVAGSWGVGDVPGTYEAIVAAGDFHPVVVCGRDEKLRDTLAAAGQGTVVGWTDDMPRLMAACDVMVENAGGLTANEAFAVGLPVVTFLPIAGHGKDNAEGMEALGVTRYARTTEELRAALDVLAVPGPERQAQIARAHALFVGGRGRRRAPRGRPARRAQHRPTDQDAEGTAADAGRRRRAARDLRAADAGRAGRHRLRRRRRRAAAPRRGEPRLPRRPADRGRDQPPGIRATLERMHATAILDAETVHATGPAVMQALAARKVDVGNGGWGEGRPFRYLRAQSDVVQSTQVITAAARVDVKEFVPGRRFDAFDQIFARRRGQRLVRPDHTLRPDGTKVELRARGVYLLDGRGSSAGELERALDGFQDGASRGDLAVTPFSALR